MLSPLPTEASSSSIGSSGSPDAIARLGTSETTATGLPALADCALHADVHDYSSAEKKLEGRCPGTFLLFSHDKRYMFSMVMPGGHVSHKPFSQEEEGWKNGGASCWKTSSELFEHLTDGMFPIPYYPTIPFELTKERFGYERPFTCYAFYKHGDAKNTLYYTDNEGNAQQNTFTYNYETLLWKNGGAGTSADALGLFHHIMSCSPSAVAPISCVV